MKTMNSPGRLERVAKIAILLVVIAPMIACASDAGPDTKGEGTEEAKESEKSDSFGNKAGFDSGIPTMRTTMKVAALRELGPYLVADLSFKNSQMQAYVAPSEGCREVFTVGEDVAYVNNGPLGVYRRGDVKCQMLGVGNLELWRDRNSRTSARGVPRKQASFKVLASDESVTMLRGLFPLAGYVGFSGGLDYVAVVANSDECRGPIEKGVSSMEYRGKGQRALSLVGKSGLCKIEALAQPVP